MHPGFRVGGDGHRELPFLLLGLDRYPGIVAPGFEPASARTIQRPSRSLSARAGLRGKRRSRVGGFASAAVAAARMAMRQVETRIVMWLRLPL